MEFIFLKNGNASFLFQAPRTFSKDKKAVFAANSLLKRFGKTQPVSMATGNVSFVSFLRPYIYCLLIFLKELCERDISSSI
jgi:hypothetical protein